jgi:hypothetical protein
MLNLTIHDSWRVHPGPLSRLLAHIAALEGPAPWTPEPTREPGQDDDDAADLARLLDGIDDAEPSPSTPAPARPAPALQPAAATPPAPRRCDGEPTTGQALYKSCLRSASLRRANAIGKARGWHKLITHWDAAQVAAAYHDLTAEPVANGRPH